MGRYTIDDYRFGKIIINGLEIGHMGEIHPEILEHYHLFNPVITAELNFAKAGLIRKKRPSMVV